MTRSKRLSRRTFLRGTGTAIALPLLHAMLPGSMGATAGNKKPTVRLACLYFPNGVWEKSWIPEQTGRDYTLPFSLEPLAHFKSQVTVLSGLDKAHSRSGDGHYAKTANFLTGMPVAKTTGKDISSGGISLDQLIANHVGKQTPLPSLELGTEPVVSGVDSNVGYTRLYGSHISWQTPTRPVAKEINPQFVYQRLFGDRKSQNNVNPKHQNLLDFAMEDARQLRGKLGRDDQFKLDEYLDSVRAVERRIEFYSKGQPRDWEPILPGELPPQPGVPNNFRDHVRLMLDLMVLAFQTDSSRVATFMFANDVSGRNFSFLDGVKGGHHELSHHEDNQEKIDQYTRINRWHVEQFVYMLDKLSKIPELDGTLLDNSMLLFGSSMSDGNRHDPNNLPILLGGSGGGAIAAGQHIASEKNTPLCNLFLSLLDPFGIEVESFGDSTGRITSLHA